MRIVVVGATGLIGGAIVARLLAEGHDVTGIARDVRRAERAIPRVRWVSLDLSPRAGADAWLPHLAGADALINCAGALQSGMRDRVGDVHRDGPIALFAACERAGPRRVVHISAIGVDRDTPTDFSRTKREGEDALMRTSLDWVILRPSVVVGRAAFGGSALLRGLAALPILPVLPDTGPLQIVQLDDVVETVLFAMRAEAPVRLALDLAGPERMSFTEAVRHYRRWIGWRPAWEWPVPAWLAGGLFALGDGAALLGWRPPIRSTARHEIARGGVGDAAQWTGITGIVPRGLADALIAQPATVQDRWFAGLYLCKALLFTVFPLFWLLTGIVSLGPGWDLGLAYMMRGGAGPLGPPVVIAGALADIAIGVAIAFRPTARLGLRAAIAVSVMYAIAGTLLLPGLWLDPLAPLLKVFPLIVLALVALAILEDR